MTEYQIRFDSTGHGSGIHRETAETERDALIQWLDYSLSMSVDITEVGE